MIDSGDFKVLVDKWMHHDRLLNGRERYFHMNNGIFIVIASLLMNFDFILVKFIGALLFIGFPWILYSYYKASHTDDMIYRDAFDDEIIEYLKSSKESGDYKFFAAKKGSIKNKWWARGFKDFELREKTLLKKRENMMYWLAIIETSIGFTLIFSLIFITVKVTPNT